jgi:WhiB family redox-sensing transcriptional regulator
MIDPTIVVDALCTQTDPEIFFPEKGQNTTQAKAICAQCPISLACLDDALSISGIDDFGIWGGTSAKERAWMRQRPAYRETIRDALRAKDIENRKALELTVIVTR